MGGDMRRESQDQLEVDSNAGRHIHVTQAVAPTDTAEDESLAVSESHGGCITPESISAISPDRSKMLEAPPSCFLRLRHLQAQGEFRGAAACFSDPARSNGGGNETSMTVAMTNKRPLSAGSRPASSMLGKAAAPVPTQSSPSAMYCTTWASHAPLRLSATPPAQVRFPRPSSDATLEVPQTQAPVPPESVVRLAAPLAPTAQSTHQVATRASTPPHPKFFAAATVAAAAPAAAEQMQRLAGQQAASCEAPCRMGVWLPSEPIAAARRVGSSYAPVRHSLPLDGAAIHGSRAATIAATRGYVGSSLDAPKARAASLPTKRGGLRGGMPA